MTYSTRDQIPASFWRDLPPPRVCTELDCYLCFLAGAAFAGLVIVGLMYLSGGV